MMDYMSVWKMRHPPFESTCDARFFFESEAHSEALARMLYLVSDRGMNMGAMTGEIGSGKTMLLNVLATRLRKDLYTTVQFPTAYFLFEQIVAEINQQLGGGSSTESSDKYRRLKEFEQLLNRKIRTAGKHLVLILDEAQFLRSECLDELKCLTNYNQQEPLLTILLSGQPELKEKLGSLPQIYQRLGMFYHLGHLRHEEVLPYLQHRLRIAGTDRLDLFTGDAIDPLFSFSGGCPRQINRVCKLAIDRACLMKKEQVDADMIRMIVRDIEMHFG